jgi:multiple sugar transport system ATP-binding protein
MTMPGVRFEHVTKRFDQVVALNDLCLDVQDKEFLVLVGPSGCGKTTALRSLAGLEEVTSGKILIGDRVVNDVAPKDRDIAMVFQSYALYPHMTVFDNIAFGLRLRGVRKQEIDRRVKEASEILGLSDLLKRRPRQLSGGQRQRVALGRAIVREPQVFLLDEPLSNLDAKLRAQTRTDISRLHQRLQTTFIYVTHDQMEAMTMATRIACMRDGLLQQLDTPQVLYSNPANVFVAGFIGSPAMNFFNAKVTKSESTLFVDCGSFTVPVPTDRVARYQNCVGRQVILGMRPEHIMDPMFAPPGVSAARVQSRVDVIEPMGNEIFLYMVAGEHSFIARVDPRTRAHTGDQMEAAFNLSQMHLFDRETQLVI